VPCHPPLRFRVEAWHDEITHGSWALLVTEGQMEDMENVRLSPSIPKIHYFWHRNATVVPPKLPILCAADKVVFKALTGISIH
jgi:hypothetical protein